MSINHALKYVEQPYVEQKTESTFLSEAIDKGKQLLGRATLMLSIVSAPSVALEVGEAVVAPQAAYAATEFSNDYPDMDATDCSKQYGVYSWCKGDPSGWLSSRRYGYRNCTDGAMYWAEKYTNTDLPNNWGNANTWDTAAAKANHIVREGNSNNIEPGDIAQDDTGDYGHVGFVTGVVKNADGTVKSIKVAELNKNAAGGASHDLYDTKNAAGKFKRGGTNDWDHFIDVNGAGKGLNNEAITGGGGGETSTPSVPAVISRNPEAMDVFYRDATNNLRNIGWSASGGWGLPSVLSSGNATGNPAAVARGNSAMDVFFADNQRRLESVGWNSTNGWGSPTVRGSNLAGAPIVVSRSPQDMDVFYRDGSDNLVNVGWNANNGWGSPSIRTSGDVAGNPTAVSRGATSMNILYRDKSSNLRSIGWDAQSGWGASDIKSSGDVAGDPAVITRSGNDMEVFYRDKNRNLKSLGWSAIYGWGSPTVRSSGDVIEDPTAAARGSSAMSAFYRDSGNNLREVSWNSTTGWGTPTSQTNGGAIGKPTAISRSATSMDVFFKDGSSFLKDQGWNASNGWRQTTLPGTNNVS